MSLVFLRPEWLWGLFGLPLLVLWWHRRRQRDDIWRTTVDAHLLPHLLGARARRGGPGLAAMLLGWTLAVAALAGPSWRSGGQPLVQQAAPLVIALDLSGAALANDLPPSRLAQARLKIATLLRERAGGEVGLVVWADDAFTVAPLTADAANVALFLDALAPGVMPVDGHRPDRAIRHAARLLERAGFRRGEILLLTGEGSNAATRAAAAVAADGYRVSVLGLGTAAGSAYREADGGFGRTRLDAPALRAIAAAGGGAYAALQAGSGDLRALGVLEPRSAAGDVHEGETLLRLDDGYWLLPPLMLLAALAFRRNALALVLVLACVPGWIPAQARAQGAVQDPPALEGGWWRRADQAAHARMQAGADAYRAGDYAAAAAAWRGLPGADAAYNLGNALARAGRYEQAIAAYDDALRRQPGMDDARANREAVLQAMQRQPPPSGPQSDPDGESSQQGEPQPGREQPADDQDEGQAGDEAGDAPATDAPPAEAPQAPDAQAQQAADDAQRERMDAALRQAEREGVDGEPAQAEAAESREEREQREANEAWLRRVPDDPGGLLREKFRLEHLRRQQGGGP
ncbi:VWA domain-containing protein [Luteimonas yindakuii]|uniref:VWA domain-containing protein n=1 Tax=Luteimonas yindakuii TaxID=2565782 RepID=A0A4Z1R1G0_9GAMM|nr:VWA domain-containing protein [Luteimonas yindakuii]TKS53342.1 VWA domain-containing protein [Luteimonas yindakuii]